MFDVFDFMSATMLHTGRASRIRSSVAVAVLVGTAVWSAAILATNADEAGTRIAAGAYQRVNESLVLHHVLPRYRRFAEATAQLRDSAGVFCTSPASDTLERAREGFRRAMDAWMAMQHLQFGPLEQKLRAHRLYFWPQARGKVGEAIAELLAAGDPEILSSKRFSRTSVAVQGLPAAEYPHFRRGEMLSRGGEAGRPACQALEAVTLNLEEIAREALGEWTDATVAHTSPSYADLMLRPGSDNAEFPASKDATLLFFSALHDELALIADVKLVPVIGDTLATARPVLAESRPSGRSTRNVETNLLALQALYIGESGSVLGDLVAVHEDDAGLDPLMRKAFRLTLDTARSIETPLEKSAGDPLLRPRAEKLSLQVRALRQLVRTRVAEALDLAVGFNALDGD